MTTPTPKAQCPHCLGWVSGPIENHLKKRHGLVVVAESERGLYFGRTTLDGRTVDHVYVRTDIPA